MSESVRKYYGTGGSSSQAITAMALLSDGSIKYDTMAWQMLPMQGDKAADAAFQVVRDSATTGFYNAKIGVYWVNESGQIKRISLKAPRSPSYGWNSIETISNASTPKFKAIDTLQQDNATYRDHTYLAAVSEDGNIWGWNGTSWKQYTTGGGYTGVAASYGAYWGTSTGLPRFAGLRSDGVPNVVIGEDAGGTPASSFDLLYDRNGVLYRLDNTEYPYLKSYGYYQRGTITTSIEYTSYTSTAYSVQNVLISTTPPDTTPPVISGADDKTITLSEAKTFNPRDGVTASDDVDGDITSRIQVRDKPSMMETTTGTYSFDYSVSDSAGNTATKHRVITVTADAPATTIACAPQTGDPAASIWQTATFLTGGLMIFLAVLAERMRRKIACRI